MMGGSAYNGLDPTGKAYHDTNDESVLPMVIEHDQLPHLRARNVYQRLAGFAESCQKELKWVITESTTPQGSIYNCQCLFGNFTTLGKSSSMQSARYASAEAMANLLDADPILRKRFSIHLQCSPAVEHADTLSQEKEGGSLKATDTDPSRDHSSRFKYLQEVSPVFKTLFQSEEKEEQQKVATSLTQPNEYREDEELNFNLSNRVDELNLSQEEHDLIKQTYQALQHYLSLALAHQSYQAVPVGSYPLACMTTVRPQIDMCLFVESSISQANGPSEMLPIDLEDLRMRLDEVFKAKVPEFPNALFAVDHGSFRRGTRQLDGNKDLGGDASCQGLIIKNLGSLEKHFEVRLFPINPPSREPGTMDRGLIGLYHSRWLIDNYNKSQEAWHTNKLFKLIRIWR